jgi:hypothetical protein
MAYDITSIRVRWLVGVASRIAEKTGKESATVVLQEIQDAIFQNDLQEGKVLISNTESGGTVTFAIPKGHTPMEIGDLVQMAIDSISGRRAIRRLRVSFRKTIS